MRGISLEEIAEATKIGTRSLRALEDEDFDKLPGGIFNKGFVRAYARYLGLDEEQAVADYQTALSDAVAAGKLTRQDSTPSPANAELIADIAEREPIRLPIGPILVLVLMVVALFAGWKYYGKNGLPKLRHVRAAQSAAPKGGSPRAETTAQASASPLPAPSPQPVGFVVRLKAKEASWVSIVADGKPVMTGELPVNAEKSIHAQQSIVIKIGNVGGIELYHNDKLVPPLGKDGRVKTLEFTAVGLR